MDDLTKNLFTHTALTRDQYCEICRRYTNCRGKCPVEALRASNNSKSLLDRLKVHILFLADCRTDQGSSRHLVDNNVYVVTGSVSIDFREDDHFVL